MKITQNDRKEIVAAIQSGKTTNELAGKYGVSSGRIGDVYREEIGEGIKRVGKLSQSDKEAIVAALQSGKADIQELATTYRVAPGTISRNFKKMVGKAFRPQRLSQIDKNLFVTALQSGEVTLEELTTRYEVSRDTISRKFKQIAGKSLHPRKLLSQRDRETIVQELQSGKTPNELAGKYSVSSSRIGQVYKAVTGKIWKPSKLSQNDKETIVAEIQSEKATMTELAKRYNVDQTTISGVFKRMTGSALRPRKTVEMLSPYRAWHKRERKMYDVWGIDWLHQKILIQVNGAEAWQGLSKFIPMRSSGLRDKKRTPEYPDGHKIYAGDIVQFPINLNEKKTEIRDVVAFDQGKGMVIVACTDFGDPLCMYNDECEVIGTIQENPELLGSELQKMLKLLKNYKLV